MQTSVLRFTGLNYFKRPMTLDEAFLSTKSIFLISPQKHILWLSLGVHTTYVYAKK